MFFWSVPQNTLNEFALTAFCKKERVNVELVEFYRTFVHILTEYGSGSNAKKQSPFFSSFSFCGSSDVISSKKPLCVRNEFFIPEFFGMHFVFVKLFLARAKPLLDREKLLLECGNASVGAQKENQFTLDALHNPADRMQD